MEDNEAFFLTNDALDFACRGKLGSAEALFQCYLCKFDENQRETKPMIISEPVADKIGEKVERIKLKRSSALFPLFLLREK